MRATNQIVPVSHKTKSKGTRRKHRRVRSDWSGCECPEGAERRSTPRIVKGSRGWTCLKLTAKGPRFVRAVCDSASARALPKFKEPGRLPSSTQKLLRADNQLFGVKSKSTKSVLSGAVCGCPEGANRVKTKSGSHCHKNGKFVKTVCVTGD